MFFCYDLYSSHTFNMCTINANHSSTYIRVIVLNGSHVTRRQPSGSKSVFYYYY